MVADRQRVLQQQGQEANAFADANRGSAGHGGRSVMDPCGAPDETQPELRSVAARQRIAGLTIPAAS
jgi:hypothetical protein